MTNSVTTPQTDRYIISYRLPAYIQIYKEVPKGTSEADVLSSVSYEDLLEGDDDEITLKDSWYGGECELSFIEFDYDHETEQETDD